MLSLVTSPKAKGFSRRTISYEKDTHQRRRAFHLATSMALKGKNSVNGSYPEGPRLLPVVMKNCDPFVSLPASKEQPLGIISRVSGATHWPSRAARVESVCA